MFEFKMVRFLITSQFAYCKVFSKLFLFFNKIIVAVK